MHGVHAGVCSDPLLPAPSQLAGDGLSSVSDVAYMAFACIFPLEKTVLKDSRPAVKQEKQHTLEQQLVQIVESVRGPGPKGVEGRCLGCCRWARSCAAASAGMHVRHTDAASFPSFPVPADTCFTLVHATAGVPAHLLLQAPHSRPCWRS